MHSGCICSSVCHSVCLWVRAKRGIWSKRMFMRTNGNFSFSMGWRNTTIILELYIKLVFSGRYRSVFLGIYHTNTKGNLGRFILVSLFWREPLFPSTRGHWPSVWGKKGALAPFLIRPAPLLRKQGVPAKLVIPTEIPTAQLNLILAEYRYQTNCW